MNTKKLVYRTHQVQSGPGKREWDAEVTFDVLDGSDVPMDTKTVKFSITNFWAQRFSSHLNPPAELPDEIFCKALAVVAEKIQTTNSMLNLSVSSIDITPGICYSSPDECVIQISL